MKSKDLKNNLVNIAVVFATIFSMLLVCEFIIRKLYKDSMVLFPRYQTDVKYGKFTTRRVRPNMEYIHRSIDGNFDFVSNNKGFRNVNDIEYPKKENELRILCLGDSHTLGYEVQQSQVFTTVIEKLFREIGKYATAINTGVSGSGTAEQLVLLKNEGYKYNPDFVVLGFYNNDFRNNQLCRFFKVEGDSLVIDNLVHAPGRNIQNFIYQFRVIKFLGENSYLYGITFNAIWEGIQKVRYRNAAEELKNEMTEYVIETRKNFSEYDILLMKKLMENMYNFCKKINAPLLIVDIPKTDVTSSIPQELITCFRDNSDTLFYVNDLKDELLALPKVHVKHGHNHISEETHNLFANKIVNFINHYYE